MQAERQGGLAQFVQQKLTVTVVEHADSSGLGQKNTGQAQLPSQRRIAPQQAQVWGLVGTQPLARLQATDAQYQCRRALGILQAPVEARQVKQDQTGSGRQFARCRQSGQWLEAHAVGRAQLTQGLREGLHAGAVFGSGQQNVGGPCRQAAQQAANHQAQPGQQVAKGWRLSRPTAHRRAENRRQSERRAGRCRAKRHDTSLVANNWRAC
ncbi:hypothetical protein D3C87_1244470 [compost metagenome]